MEYFRSQVELGMINSADPDQAEIILSNKGGPKLIDNGFMYTMHKKQTSNIRWRCVLRSSQCRGSLVTSTDFKLPRVRMEHNHEPDYAGARLARARYRALDRPMFQGANPNMSFDDIPPLLDKIKQEPTDDYEEVNFRQPIFQMQPASPGQNFTRRTNKVMQSGSQGSSGGRTIRIAAQSLVRQPLRNIAPAPTSSQHHRQQQQQQQQHPKTLVLKTIPLKVKQVAPTTIKMTPRPPHMAMPQNILPQPSTEVCLRWNSYHSNMQNSFPSLLDTEQFVDVTLACEGRSLKCHKMILSSCSDYLAALLRENPCQHPIILMRDLKFWEVEALVKFMYKGEVNVAHDKLPQLLNAAEALQIKGLAGPSPSLQNPKPPKLVPQSKPLSHASSSAMSGGSPRVAGEPKESRGKVSSLSSVPGMTPTSTTAASTTSAPTTTTATSGLAAVASPKRSQKRQASEPPQPRIFTKIRLQRPVTPTSPNLTVKSEPLDIPLSPTDIFPDRHHHHHHHRRRRHHQQHRPRRHSRDEDISSTASNFDNLVMALHDEDEDEDHPGGPGGPGPEDDVGPPGVDEDDDVVDEEDDDERCSDDGDINFRVNMAARSNQDHNENEEQMEFVPTDFLDQEQDIVEEAEFSKSSDDEDEEEDDEEREEEEDDDDGAEEVDDDLVEETLRGSTEERKKNQSDDHRNSNDKRAEQCTNSDKTLT